MAGLNDRVALVTGGIGGCGLGARGLTKVASLL